MLNCMRGIFLHAMVRLHEPGAIIRRMTQFVILILLAVALSACERAHNPAGPGGGVTVVASGHPEWPPIMFQSGSTIDGAGPALVRKIFSDLGVTVAFPQKGTWDEVQVKARS